MNLRELLQEIDFCEKRYYTDREFYLKNSNNNGSEYKEIIPYYCCKTRSKYKEKCEYEYTGNSVNCASCSKVVYKYVIFDLDHKRTAEVLRDYVLNDFSCFQYFQEYNIADMFFGEDNYVRFNTYVLFTASEASQFPEHKLRVEIESDLSYARKKILLLNNLIEFAVLDKVNISKTENILFQKYISEVIEKTHRNGKNDKGGANLCDGLSGYFVDNAEDNKCKERLLTHIENKCVSGSKGETYNQIMIRDGALGFEGYDNFISQYFGKHIQNGRQSTPTHISAIEFNNYRERLSLPKDVAFGKVTLLYAKNGVGKTSFLDAIANALAGVGEDSSHDDNEKFTAALANGKKYESAYKRSDGDSSNDILYTVCDGGREKRRRREIINKRKSEFYPNHSGELSDLFRSINYFELDAVAKFARGDDVLHRLFADIALDRFCNRVDQLKEILREVISESKKYIAPESIRSGIKEGGEWLKYQEILILKRDKCEYFLKHIQKSTEDMPKYSWRDEMKSKLPEINKIYRKLHSFEEELVINSGGLLCVDDGNEIKTCAELHAAQRACVALSVALSQFLWSGSTLDFMLLDEPMANLDSLHLLNLFDLLRDLAIAGHQIVFATANQTFKDIAKVKFFCLTDQHHKTIEFHK